MATMHVGLPQAAHSDVAGVQRLLSHERLLRNEAEHRLANLLQLVSSNLEMAARSAEGEQARSAIGAAADQTVLLGMLHRSLKHSGRTRHEDCGAKLRQLCSALDALVLRPRGHCLAFEPEAGATELELPSESARCLALIVSELVINAAKHAFAPGSAGRITVVLARTTDRVSCTVLDDGYGAQSGSKNLYSRGIRLAQSIAEQAGGECRWVFSLTGTEAHVSLSLTSCGRPASTVAPANLPALLSFS